MTVVCLALRNVLHIAPGKVLPRCFRCLGGLKMIYIHRSIFYGICAFLKSATARPETSDPEI